MASSPLKNEATAHSAVPMRPPALVNSFHYLFQTGLASLLRLNAIPPIPRSLSPPDLGDFALAQTRGTLLAALATEIGIAQV